MAQLRITPRGLTAHEIDCLADRMQDVAITARIEGASDDQLFMWMRVALFEHLNQGKPFDVSDESLSRG